MISFFKEVYQTLLSIDSSKASEKSYRSPLLILTGLILSSSVLLLFAFLNAFVLNPTSFSVAIIDLMASLVILYGIYDLKKNLNGNRAALTATFGLFIFFITFAYLNQNESFGLIWLVFMPIFAITFNQPKLGLIISLTFTTIITLMAFNGIGEWQNGQWDGKSVWRLTIALMLIIFIIYLHEIAVAKAKSVEKEAMQMLEELSLLDELTQIANRRRINALLDIEMTRAKRYKTEFSIVLFDIDNFKNINDNYGHLVGDQVLQILAEQIKHAIRNNETFGRWGGEEFILILPKENSETAAKVAEKIRQLITKIDFPALDCHLTCSFGVGQHTKDMSLEALIDCADNALYQAKNSGKNRVIICHKQH